MKAILYTVITYLLLSMIVYALHSEEIDAASVVYKWMKLCQKTASKFGEWGIEAETTYQKLISDRIV